MFLGSGMPRNLWTRVADRFPDVRILEFYASAEGDAILANLTGQKPGSMGKALPGTAEVRVAAFDLERTRLDLTSGAVAREALADEVGLLVSRVAPGEVSVGTPMRSVFAPDDAWRSSGDLFLRDQQGDLWLAGPVREVVQTANGPVLPAGTRFCLAMVPGSDLVVAYGVEEDGAEVLVGAFTVLPGADVDAAELDKAMDRLPLAQRPAYVQQVASLPLTTWHRPVWSDLQKKGVPKPARGRKVWRLEADGHYAEVRPAPRKRASSSS